MTDDPELLEIYNASASGDYDRYIALLRKRYPHPLRTATLRTNIHYEAAMDDYTSPDPYAHDVRILQERYATRMSIFEANDKIRRAIELDAERIAAAKVTPRTLASKLDLAAAIPPDPYAAAAAARRTADESHTRLGSR